LDGGLVTLFVVALDSSDIGTSAAAAAASLDGRLGSPTGLLLPL